MSIPNRAYNLLRGYIGREFERIQGIDRDQALKEISETLSTQPASPAQHTPATKHDRVERARSILGISADADFTTIRAAYQRLNRRSDPASFPSGSAEAAQAAQIQRKVQEAYRVLAEQNDAVEVRFKSLEIE